MSIGEHATAAELLEVLCRRPTSVASHLMLVFNRAVTYQCLGDYERALPLYREVLAARGLGPRRVMAAQGDLLRARSAEAFAWYGDLDAAESLLAEIDDEEAVPVARVAPRAIIALRRGDANAALALIEAGWAEVAEALGPLELAPLRLVYVVTLQALGREGDEVYTVQCAALDPPTVAVCLWTGRHWPEMATLTDALGAAA